MNHHGFRTVLFLSFTLIFLATATLTLLALAGKITIHEFYLKSLFSALILETVGAITMLFRRYFTDHAEIPISKLSPRQLALEGSWDGGGEQDVGPWGSAFETQILMTLKISNSKVSGTLKFSFEHGVTFKHHEHSFYVEGELLLDRFLQLQYKNTVASTIQFGSIILELNSDCSALDGRYLGYGVESRKIIYGTAILKKM